MDVNLISLGDFQAQQAAAGRATRGLAPTDNRARAEAAAKEFEAIFISQMLAPIFNTIPTDGLFGGGHAESVYRGLQVDEMGKAIVKQGGIGIADSVMRELLSHQEAANG